MLGNHGQLGATVPGPGIHDWQAMLIEAAITAGLVSTILGTSSTAQNVGALSAVAVGAYIALAGLWSSPVSGASMNPARSFGPDVIRGLTGYWVYVVGPALGALIAVGSPMCCAAGEAAPAGDVAARERSGSGSAAGGLSSKCLRRG